MSDNIKLGKLGEELALKFLLNKNYTLLDKNFRSSFGEIDIVCRYGNKIIFIEVKSSLIGSRVLPYEEMTRRKFDHLRKVINYYLLKKKLGSYKLCLGVVSVQFNSNLNVSKLNYYENVDFLL